MLGDKTNSGVGLARAFALLAVLATLLLLGREGAAAETVAIEEPEVQADLYLFPKALPRSELAPAALEMKLRYPRGEGRPQKQIDLLLDRNLALDFRGFPDCRSEDKITSQSWPPPPIEQRCPGAIVGRGEAMIEVNFPDSEPVSEASRLTVVNGGMRKGAQIVHVLAPISVPVPAEVVMTLEIRSVRDGRYGTRATLTIPKIAGGSGSLTSLRLKLDRKDRRSGRTASVVSARCPDGKLQLRAETLFADGTRLEQDTVRPCTPR